MRMLHLAMLGALFALLAGSLTPQPAAAQSGRPAASTWFDSYGRGQGNRLIDLQAAEVQERARSGGYGPGISNTYIDGDVNTTNTYNGPVNSSTAYNSVNSNTVGVTNTGNGSVTVTTGQTAGRTNQTATSGTFRGSGSGQNVSCTSAAIC
ncbi:MAG: hypothetical protein V4644_02375 [Patescibacteria group bacterium]